MTPIVCTHLFAIRNNYMNNLYQANIRSPTFEPVQKINYLFVIPYRSVYWGCYYATALDIEVDPIRKKHVK